jgi:hypothetical protein
MLKKFALGTAIVLVTASASLAASQTYPRNSGSTIYNPAPIVETCSLRVAFPQCSQGF